MSDKLTPENRKFLDTMVPLLRRTHRTYHLSLKQYAGEVLGRPVDDWRELSHADKTTVWQVAKHIPDEGYATRL